MKSERLLDQLTNDLQPVPRPRDLRAVAPAAAVFGAASAVALVAALFHFRGDLDVVSRELWFVANLASLAAAAGFAAYCGLASALPGRPAPYPALAGLQLSLFAFFVTLLPSLSHMPLAEAMRAGANPAGVACCGLVLTLSLIPGLLLYFLVTKLAPTEPRRTAWMIGLAMSGVGALGTGLHCPVMNPFHVALYHGLPIFLIAAIAATAGRRLLRW
jgi:hypothetical protein